MFFNGMEYVEYINPELFWCIKLLKIVFIFFI